MEGVTIEYEVHLLSLRRFGRRRFGLKLYAEGVYTGISQQGLTLQEARSEGAIMLQEAAELVEFLGLSGSVAQSVHEERGYRLAGVRPGDMVTLRHGTGPFPAGYRCEVLHVDLNEDWTDLDDYPVAVMPFLTRKEIELQVDEFDRLIPLGVQAWGPR